MAKNEVCHNDTPKPEPIPPRDAVKSAFEVGKALGAHCGYPQVGLGPEFAPFTVLPRSNGCMEVVGLTAFQKVRPDRIVRRATFTTAESFALYVKEFWTEATRLYAYVGRGADDGEIVAVLDDHLAPNETESESLAAWCSHRAALRPQVSEQWEAWLSMNRKPMSQEAFAEFIEEHLGDVIDPKPAAMLEAATNLSAHKTARFGSSIRLSDGQVQFGYVEEIRGNQTEGSMRAPEIFTLHIPVYYAAPSVAVTARLRYRFPDGKLTMWYALLGVTAIQTAAFEGACKFVQSETGREVLFGSVNGNEE